MALSSKAKNRILSGLPILGKLESPYGPTYRISFYTAASFRWAKGSEKRRYLVSLKKESLKEEFFLLKNLYDAGVKVPRPLDICMFPPLRKERWDKKGDLDSILFPAIVQEYVEGVDPYSIKYEAEDMDRMKQLMEHEKEKINRLGIKDWSADFRLVLNPILRDKGDIYLSNFRKQAS